MRSAALALLLIAGSPAAAQTVTFYTGQEFLNLTPDDRTLFTAGAFDGMSATLAILEPGLGKYVGVCIGTRTSGQLAAMFEKYLRERPDKWHFAAASTFGAMILNEVCK